MAKLSKRQAAEIAMLVNAIEVWEMMRRDARADDRQEDAEQACKRADEARIELADRFGVELPTLNHSRDRQERRAAEAAQG